MGAHFEALDEGVLLVPLDPRYTQVGFNLVSVQVCVSLVEMVFHLLFSRVLGKACFCTPRQKITLIKSELLTLEQ